MFPNQILSQSLLREVNQSDHFEPISRPSIPAPSFQERDLIGKLSQEDQAFEKMRFKNAPTSVSKMNDIMDMKRKRDIKPTEDDLEYQKLIKQLEYATGRNAQYKQDMNMLDTALDGLDPKKKMLVGNDVDKKFALESLRSKRMQIRDKESVFLDQLKQFQDYYAFNERNRIEKGIINEDFLGSKRPKILELKLMQEQINNDKTNFLDQFDKIRSGYSVKPQPYFTSVGAATLGLGGNPSYLAVDYDLGRAKDRLQDDAKRIEKMKQDNMYYFTRNHLEVDPEEVFGSNKVNFKNEVRYLMDTNKYAQTGEQKYAKLKQIRENIEKLGAEKGLNAAKVKLQFIEENPDSIQAYQSTLRDIEALRKDYIQSGGTDPEFLLNLQNLEQFYKDNRFNPINRDLIRIHQGLPITGSDPPGFYYNSSVAPPNGGQAGMQPGIARMGNNQGAPQQNFSMAPELGVDLQKYENLPPEETITNHPIYEYLPEAFKKQVIDLEQRNKTMRNDLSSIHVPQAVDIPTNLVDANALFPRPGDNTQTTRTEEQMLNYVRGQESEILLNMSRLRPNQVEYSAKHSQFLQVQQIKASLERSILDKKVQDAIKNAGGQSMNQSTMGGNVSIIGSGAGGMDQSMTANMGSLQRASTMYTPNEGFMLRWDWIGSLPINYQKMKVMFGVFRKGDNFFAYRETNMFPTEQETYRSNKCIFLQKEVLRDVQPFPDTVVYCEFWGYLYTSDGVPAKPEVIGWSMHELFDYNGLLTPGKFRLPFYSKVFQPNEIFSEGLPYMSNSALFIRVCLPMDPYFDVDSTVMLQNEYKVQELHLRKKRILKLDENTNAYVSDVSNRYMYAGTDKNMSYDPNGSSIQNYDQSTQLPNQSVLAPQVIREDNLKMPDFSQFGPQGTKSQFGFQSDPSKQDAQSQMNQSSRMPSKPMGTSTLIPSKPMGTSTLIPSLPTRRQVGISQPSMFSASEASRGVSSTSIEMLNNVSKVDQPCSLRIKLNKLTNVKIDVKTLQVRSVIFQKNEIVLTRNKNPSADNVKLEEVNLSKTTNELILNIQMNQDIDWKSIMQKNTKRDLEKVVFYCAIFKCVIGKEDELLGWLVWPIYKVDNDSKNVNMGVFTTSIFKKPAQKPPFGEKKEKSDIQLNFEIEAIGYDPSAAQTTQERNKSMERNKSYLGTQQLIPEEDELRATSGKLTSTKYIEEPLDNARKLVVDLLGLQKYLLTKNDLQYKMEILKDGLPVVDENGHKCIEQKNINIAEKGRDNWKLNTEQRFELGQTSLFSQFKEATYSKGIILVTIMIKDKTDIVGQAKIPLFQTGSSHLSEGRNKIGMIKIEKNGTEKQLLFILDYQLSYINHNLMASKKYDPNKGLRILINELSNYREKWDVTYTVSVLKGTKVMENNMGKETKYQGQEFVANVVKEKKVPFKDSVFLPINIEKVKDQQRKELDDMYILFEFIVDKSSGQAGQEKEEPFAWYAHRLFNDGALNGGKFNDQVFVLPIVNNVIPIDPKKMKKLLVKFDYEIGEDVGKSMPEQPAPLSQGMKSMVINSIESETQNSFNVLIDSFSKVKFKGPVTAKIAIILVDDIFQSSHGDQCSYTGEASKPLGDVLDLGEEFDIDVDVELIKKKYPKQLDSFFLFVNLLDQQPKPVLWFLTKIFDKGELKVGKFTETAFEPPVQPKFSSALRTAKKSTSTITYEIRKGLSDEMSMG